MTQAKPTPGPVLWVTFYGTPPVVRLHDSKEKAKAQASRAAAMYDLRGGYMLPADSEVLADVELWQAATDAAHAAAELGYDPIEAVRALPGLLKEAAAAQGVIEDEYPPTDDPNTCYGVSVRIRDILAAARGTDRKPG